MIFSPFLPAFIAKLMATITFHFQATRLFFNKYFAFWIRTFPLIEINLLQAIGFCQFFRLVFTFSCVLNFIAFFTIELTAFQALSSFNNSWAIRNCTWWRYTFIFEESFNLCLFPNRFNIIRKILENIILSSFIDHEFLAGFLDTFRIIFFLNSCNDLLFTTF